MLLFLFHPYFVIHHLIEYDDIINIKDLDIDKILLGEKSCENILIYKVAYKT